MRGEVFRMSLHADPERGECMRVRGQQAVVADQVDLGRSRLLRKRTGGAQLVADQQAGEIRRLRNASRIFMRKAEQAGGVDQ